MIKVNLCCGKTDFGPTWISIDKGNFPHIKYKDVTKLPFEDNSIDLEYCSHGIAYFNRFEIIPVLKEWYNKLKPGGVLRISTTDWDRLLYIYKKRGAELKNLLGPLFGLITINNENLYHKTVYNFKELKELLLSIGFKKIRHWSWKKIDPHRTIDDQSRAYFPKKPELYKSGKFTKDQVMISLNIEAIK